VTRVYNLDIIYNCSRHRLTLKGRPCGG